MVRLSHLDTSLGTLGSFAQLHGSGVRVLTGWGCRYGTFSASWTIPMSPRYPPSTHCLTHGGFYDSTAMVLASSAYMYSSALLITSWGNARLEGNYINTHNYSLDDISNSGDTA